MSEPMPSLPSDNQGDPPSPPPPTTPRDAGVPGTGDTDGPARPENPRRCDACGGDVPADAPGGTCPRCLLAAGFATGLGGGSLPPPEVPAAEVERRFPQYAVTGLIGRGGMGVVFRARQRTLDREVALKVLPMAPGRPPDFAERFQREARALARLRHPGIVQVHDFGVSDDGWCFLAMELVDGPNLRRILAEHRLPPREALAIVPQICDALQYAHDNGIVHRDIKPENVLVDRQGRVRIADFGLAKLVEGPRHEATLTRSGIVMGTPHYMAPEQIEKPADVDHRADIYSLGVVFYEMLTGELPLGRFPAPSRRSDVDARIDEIVLRTLEKERDLRYQRAGDVTTEIRAAATRPAAPPPLPAMPALDVPTPAPYPDTRRRLLGILPPKTETAPPLPPPPPPKLSRLALVAAAMPLVVALTALGAWDANRGTEFPTRMTVAALWTAAVLFAAILTCVGAWARIRHSGRTLYGRRFVLIGLLGSLAAPAAGAPAAFIEMQNWERGRATPPTPQWTPAAPADVVTTIVDSEGNRRRTRYVDGVEIPPDTPDADVPLLVHGPRIRALFDRATRIWPSRASHLLHPVYDSQDVQFIGMLEAPVVEERRAAGTLGLPLADASFLGAPLQSFQVGQITLESGAKRGTVTVTDGTRSFRATVVRMSYGSPDAWRFALARVEAVAPEPPAAEQVPGEPAAGPIDDGRGPEPVQEDSPPQVPK